MSVHTSPSRLAVAIVAGPLAALMNQGSIYAVSAWGCGPATHAFLHAIAAVCFVVATGTAVIASRWRRLIPVDEGDGNSEGQRRTRFVTVVATNLALLSSVVILAQWLAVVLFAPCVRS